MGLDSVKVGDYLRVGRYCLDGQIVRVTTVTKTQVVCGDLRFRKVNGVRVGDSNDIGKMRARIATQQDFLEIRLRNAKQALRSFDVTAQNLDRVEQLLNTGD